MASKILIDYAGAACRATARDRQGRDIYDDNRACKLWLEMPSEAYESFCAGSRSSGERERSMIERIIYTRKAECKELGVQHQHLCVILPP